MLKMFKIGSLKLYALIVFLLTLIGGLLYWILKGKKKADETDEVKNADTDGQAFSDVGIKPSYPQSWYDEYAKQFFEKYRPFKFITKAKKADMVYELIKIKNYQDFLQIKKSFGIRTDYGFDYTLPEFVVARFHPDAVSTYNYHVANLLEMAKKRGVKFGV